MRNSEVKCLQNNINCIKTQTMGDPGEKEEEEGCLFTDILAEDFLSLLYGTDIQVHRIQRISRR